MAFNYNNQYNPQNPHIIVNGQEFASLRSFEPLNVSEISKAGITFSGIIHDVDRFFIFTKLLPVNFKLEDDVIKVTLFHDFVYPETHDFYESLLNLQAEFNRALTVFRDHMTQLHPLEPVVGQQQNVALTEILGMGTELQLSQEFLNLSSIIDRHLGALWPNNPQKRIRLLTFQRGNHVELQSLFQFENQFYARDIQIPHYSEDTKFTRIRQAKTKWTAVMHQFGIQEGTGLVFLYLDSILGEAKVDPKDTGKLIGILTSLIDRLHFNPYSIDNYADPYTYVFSLMWLLATYQYIRTDIDAGVFFEEGRFQIFSTTATEGRPESYVSTWADAFTRMGWKQEGGSKQIFCLPIGDGEELNLVTLNSNEDGIVLPNPPATQELIDQERENLGIDEVPLIRFQARPALNIFKDTPLPTKNAHFDRIRGITIDLDKTTAQLLITSTSPWTLVRQMPQNRINAVMHWPIRYHRFAPNQLLTLAPTIENHAYIDQWFEGFTCLFSGNAFQFNWNITRSEIFKKYEYKNSDPLVVTAPRLDFSQTSFELKL